MQKKKLFLMLFMVMIYSFSWAQNHSVSGIVYDSDGEALVGATVVVEGTTIGTVTDIDGRFNLKTNANDVLVFSFIGFSSKKIPVNGQTVVNVTLSSSAQTLDDVIIVGYGTQKKASVVASISQVSSEEILRTGNVTTVSQALQGLMPGVISITETGKPGADAANVTIRGMSSWQSSEPLVLVDGVERDMNDIDPNEIATISVLKDGSATAVFGVKGGNGVILITTKRGSIAPPSISFSSNFGFKQPTSIPEFADYATSLRMHNESLANDNRWNEMIPESKIQAWEDNWSQAGPYNDYYPNIDWWNEMVKPVGYQQQYNIQVRGGTNFVKYFTSLGFLNDGDIFNTEKNELFDPAFSYKRYNWRSNFDFSLTKTTTFSVDLSGKVGYRSQPGYRINDALSQDDSNSFGQPQFFQQLYNSGMNEFPIKYSDGEWGAAPDGTGNIMADFNKGQRLYRYYQGFVDFKLKQELGFITKGLSLNGKFSFNSETSYLSNIQRFAGSNFGETYPVRFSRDWDYTNPNADGSLPLQNEVRWPIGETQNPPPSAGYDNMMKGGFSKSLYYEIALNWAREFGNHNLSALALFSRRESEGLLSDNVERLKIPSHREDWVGRVTYGYADRYLLEFNGAYNGSEQFAPGLRFGFFPSLSAGWVLSEEPFIKDFAEEVLTMLKIKYSYGKSGFDNIPGSRFNYIQTFTSSGNLALGLQTPQNFGPRYHEGAAANPFATWEKSTKQNIGLELGLLEKFTFNMDVFKENRTDILMEVWSPLWLGIKNPRGNVGETMNQGVDFEAEWKDKVNKNFSYWIKGNLSFNENRIIYRNDGVNVEPHLMEAGKPIRWQKKYIMHDYYQSIDDIFNYAIPESRNVQSGLVPGDFMFIDYNGDGVIDTKDQVAMGDVTYPLNTFGFSLGMNYKNFGFNAMFYGVSDISKEVPNLILYDLWNSEKGIYKAGNNVEQRWTPETASTASKPALHTTSALRNYSQSNSTYSYQDASYLRLKNIEFSYTFSNIKLVGISKLKIYANGNNLITWTNLDKRMDPETRNAGVYPVVRRYNIGINATF